MSDTYGEYTLAGFAVIFSILIATVFGLIGIAQAQYVEVEDNLELYTDTDLNIFEGIGEFFRNDNFGGWERFFYTVVIFSPMLTVGTMIFLNWGRGR